VPLSAKQAKTIRAELVGDNGCHCAAIGEYVSADSPVIEMCRRLVRAGYHPDTCLDCFCGATLCLTVYSIGLAAGVKIGNGFEPVSTVRTASLVRHSHQAGTSGTRTKRRRRSAPHGDRGRERHHDITTALNPGC
jgi:hypothetical protein